MTVVNYRDVCGVVAYNVCKSRGVRNEYRKFMAAQPDRYSLMAATVECWCFESSRNSWKIFVL